MQHQESEVKVFKTSEYSRFKMISGNRDINEAKIKRIKKEITANNDWLKLYPVLVREKFEKLEILDGQHRFHISRELKRPVYYIIIEEEKSMPDIAKVNSNVEKWKAKHFINCYVSQGNNNYKQLQEFLNLYNLPIAISLKMLYYGNPGSEGFDGKLTGSFQNGDFIVRFHKEALVMAEQFRQFEKYEYWRQPSFCIALYRVIKMEKVGLDVLVQAYKKRPEMLKKQSTYKDYIYALESMLNVGKQQRVTII